jgi:guanylate kinase
MRKLPEAVSIFILPPSPETLERRLRHRSVAEHVTSEEVIARRLQEARKELDRIGEYRYAIVNDQLDEAVDELRAIVLTERQDGEADHKLARSCLTTSRSRRLVEALGSFERHEVAQKM